MCETKRQVIPAQLWALYLFLHLVCVIDTSWDCWNLKDMIPWKNVLNQLLLICWVPAMFQTLVWNQGSISNSPINMRWTNIMATGCSCLQEQIFYISTLCSVMGISHVSSIYIMESKHARNQSFFFPENQHTTEDRSYFPHFTGETKVQKRKSQMCLTLKTTWVFGRQGTII